ncbi:anti-sigma regulatory factor [Clostridium thermosuccinogenes]|jgi:anti-sigma regulatory factor (Ser/Thr protein kinase)|uniref:Anti-sigma regulatory factor n=1 Tax=Clostridium thermosuccinogenes TaxID=84032 RepID=A0A2K2FRP8_9CLOT|nr:anti-sigma regulatory factor [Pseudoclostridium thermosuccinogenes]AUS97832.1 anti-sigma regulatory factor [Pseudoclostridium thermosuccinogenes]PNT94082.1 anti-sigma regulatory factor [Pseudoclostridium thermosuccinogenes]PNU00128.1 anti-sigma regulatory factor [Pseudoclostridium thermosuccinogenes]PNU01453.1 anti-sigma regulatory factor [Pseudoclostridium thermosuccinogenes]
MGLSGASLKLHYDIPADDFSLAGEASSNVKKVLSQLGISPALIKKTTVSMYEAEINAVIHAGGGTADIDISPEKIVVEITDHGPGIEDVELAMQEGYSTAPDSVRELGFGAGMGLPNMKRYSDEMIIDTEVGKGTKVTMIVYLK